MNVATVVGTFANAGELDVGAYLREVGLAQALEWEPTVRSLARLQRAYLDAFAFADVTTALGGVPRLDLATLEQRMAKEGRGGYCLEHVTLFAAVLEALGFACALRLGRVGDGSDETRPATHLTVLAQPIDDGRWWRHDAADDEISRSNRWVALEPDSPFAGQLIALRSGDERRERFVGTRFEVIAAGGHRVEHKGGDGGGFQVCRLPDKGVVIRSQPHLQPMTFGRGAGVPPRSAVKH